MTRDIHRRLFVIILVVAGLVVAPAVGIGAVAAQSEEDESADEKAPIYDEEDRNPDTDGWLDDVDDPSISSIITLLSRMGSFVIGAGGSGLGQSAPALLTGILVLGTALGMTTGSGVGSIGGSVLAVTGVFSVVAVGLAPEWGTVIAVFGVGLVLAAVFRRVL